MTQEEAELRLENSPLKKFQDSNLQKNYEYSLIQYNSEIQALTRKYYQDSTETKKLIDEIFK